MKVEVAVLGSPALIVLNMVCVDMQQHLKKKKKALWFVSSRDLRLVLHHGNPAAGRRL